MAFIMGLMNLNLMATGYMYITQEKRMERSLAIPLTMICQLMRVIHIEAQLVFDYVYKPLKKPGHQVQAFLLNVITFQCKNWRRHH